MKIIDIISNEDEAQGVADLTALGYGEPERVKKDFTLLSKGPLSASLDSVSALALASPSPERALNSLERVAASVGDSSLKAFLAGEENLARLLFICGSSELISGIFCKHPPLFDELFSGGALSERKDVNLFTEELNESAEHAENSVIMARELRVYKQREYIRIGGRDLLGLADVREVTAELSDLASASLDVALRYELKGLKKSHGAPLYIDENGEEREAELTIIGMGKLGGRELNFSSDIDIIYIYSTDGVSGDKAPGETTGAGDRRGSAISFNMFFVKLAERVTSLINAVTEDGFVFRVDLDLRPEGRSGMIATSLDLAELYYESWGQCWERSAMIKARPVAGSVSLGEEFLKMIKPFVYRRSMDFTAIEEIKSMKEKIDLRLLKKGTDTVDVKLGAGGIREIEFFCQALQLIHGGKLPAIRERSTLKTIEALLIEGLLTRTEAIELTDSYIFLRNVEHRIQLVEGRQTHVIPARTAELTRLAAMMGTHVRAYEKGEGFMIDYKERTARVYDIYRSLFYSASEELGAGVVDEASPLFSPDITVDEAAPVFTSLGFTYTEAAFSHLRTVMSGKRLPPRGRVLLEKLVPYMLRRAALSPDPDKALTHLAAFITSIGARTTFFSLLSENLKVVDLLINIFGTSEFLSTTLIKQPGAIDHLLSRDITKPYKTTEEISRDLDEVLKEASGFEDSLDALRRFKNQEIFRIGVNDVLGELDTRGASEQISSLAEAALDGAYRISKNEVGKRYGSPQEEARFAVLGLGKLGSRELIYGSDLDIVFIYSVTSKEGKEGSEATMTTEGIGIKEIGVHEYFVKLGQKMISVLTLKTREGSVFEVDMRLRPSGSSGPLVLSERAFLSYQREKAEIWELQALTRVRAVAGDSDYGETLSSLLYGIVSSRGLSTSDIAEIIRIRRRMEDEIAKEGQGRYNIKTGRGGIVDIEFLVQVMQLKYAGEYPELRTPYTMVSLGLLAGLGLIYEAEYNLLKEAYEFLRKIEIKLRIVHDRPEGSLSEGTEELASLAKRARYDGDDPAGSLIKDYLDYTARVRDIYDKKMKELSA
ncbi:MAG: bifunctional [glutamate--ammonia ligase]-adenylyl-L-tyrosine phosphorylase/[glutamate--ammonia-ligase] adenylyltransferase [Thermodesulfobacteriota bacterium]